MNIPVCPALNFKGETMIDKALERGIRCKCGKYWGMYNHKKNCKRCKTPVIARGELPKKIEKAQEFIL